MSLLDDMIPKAQQAGKTIVLPEGHDPRIIDAAKQIAEKMIAKVIVLADADELNDIDSSIQSDHLCIWNYKTSEHREQLGEAFQVVRVHKGITREQAMEAMDDRLYFANMMIRNGLADGLVAGSIASTADMLRASFQCIGTADGINIASSSFLMELASPSPAGDRVLAFADCAVNPNPSADELVDIALSTAQTHTALVGTQPRVAFLSFSSRGSAKHELVEKVQTATAKAKETVAAKGLDMLIDGELQLDAAIVPKVAAKKCADSPLKGAANILIFPDLQAGNIGYKLTERLAGAKALGPVLQGLAKPVNDLSRGCSVDDIIGVAVITACQAAVE